MPEATGQTTYEGAGTFKHETPSSSPSAGASADSGVKPDENLIKNGSTEEVVNHMKQLMKKPTLSSEERKAIEQALSQRWSAMSKRDARSEYAKIAFSSHPDATGKKYSDDVMKAVNAVYDSKIRRG